jgi:hypothetical protein
MAAYTWRGSIQALLSAIHVHLHLHRSVPRYCFFAHHFVAESVRSEIEKEPRDRNSERPGGA